MGITKKSYNQDNQYILEELKKFVKSEIAPYETTWDKENTFPLDIFKQLHRLGWLQSFIPTHLGGLGLSTSTLCQMYKTIAQESRGITTSMAGNMLAFLPIIKHGSKKLQDKIIKRYLNDFFLMSFCFTEPDSGSNVFNIKTNANKVDKGFVLNGKKCFVTNANYSEYLLVVAVNKDITNSKNNFSLFCIPKNSKGVKVASAYNKIGHRSSNTSEIFFEDVFVPLENCIGLDGNGINIAFDSIQRSRIFLSSSAIGLCEKAFDITCNYLENRSIYGKPLLSKEQIRGKLSDLYTKKHAGWLLTLDAAEKWDSGDNSFVPSSMAKLYCGNIAMDFSRECMEFFGAWGLTKEYPIELLYRDAKFYEILEGATFVQQAIISKEIFRKKIKLVG